MDAKTKRLFSIMLYFGLAAGAIVLRFNAAHVYREAWTAYFFFAALLIAQNVLIIMGKMCMWSNAVCFALGMVLALCVQYFDRTGFTGFTVMTVTIIGMLSLKPLVIYPIASAALAASAFLYCLSNGVTAQDFWPSIGTVFLHRLILLFAVAITRYSITVNVKNRELVESLGQKTGELEDALERLRLHAEEVKESADLRVKDQLMRELHDRLGHLLVTASISAQAANVLVDRDPPAAKERLGTACELIQAAMGSLRAVLTGRTGASEPEATFGELVRLAREAESRTGIPIRMACPSAEDFDFLPQAQRSFLYNSLMEGLTNGIRHGHGTQFDVSLMQTDGWFLFSLRDDGIGFREIRYGYGLSKIAKDARRFGGSLEMNGEHGCELKILLPLDPRRTMEESGYA